MDHLIRAFLEKLNDEPISASERQDATFVIMNMTKKQRLDMYLKWNGIIGWTETIWELATIEPTEQGY